MENRPPPPNPADPPPHPHVPFPYPPNTPQPNVPYQPSGVQPPVPYPPVAPNPGPVPTAKPRRPRTLGVLGLIIVIAATVFTSLVALWLVAATTGPLNGDPKPVPPLGIGLAIGGATLGVLGFILSIMATVQGRGRGFGIAGIVIGVLAYPIVSAVSAVGLIAAWS